MIIFPITYILLLVVTIRKAQRRGRKAKRSEPKRREQSIEVVPVVHDPLPACFTIEWDLENGGSKITVDE